MRVEEDEQIGRAVAAILAVVALELPGLGRDRLAHLADQLDRALVEADHRPLRIGRLGIEIEHVLHAGDVLGVDLGDAPHLPAPRLELVLGQAPAHRLARQALMLGQLDHLAGQQLQRPARTAGRRVRAGGRHQQGLLLAGELALGAGPRLLAQRRLQLAFDEAPLGPVHRRAARPRHVVAISSSRHPRIGRQQDLRPLELPRRLLAAAQQRPKFIALVLGQLDTIAYIHRSLRVGGPVESTDESNVWRTEAQLHAQAGPVSGLHRRLYARPPAGRPPKPTSSAASASPRLPSTRWFSPSNAQASSAANPASRAASRCSCHPSTYPSWKLQPNPSKPLCRGTRGR